MDEIDPRREVAERLRGLRHRTYYREEIVESICDAISIADPVNTFREPEDVYELLADLIDPTCTVVSDDVFFGSFGCEEAGYKFKLSCGHEVLSECEYPPDYCSECGARVVSGNG